MHESRWQEGIKYSEHLLQFGFFVGNFNICDPAESRLNSRIKMFSDGDISRALFAAFPRSHVKICGVMDLLIPYLVLPSFLLTFRWLTYAISSAIPTRSEQLATSLSDHIPVRSGHRLPSQEATPDHPVIRRWLTKHTLHVLCIVSSAPYHIYDVERQSGAAFHDTLERNHP